MAKRRSIFLTSLLVCSGWALAQAEPDTLMRIVEEGKNNNQCMRFLRHLTLDIGSRLTGSPNLAKAYAYTKAEFEKMGCVNVHLEKWSDWPVGFQRGPARGGMVSPERSDFVFTTPSWTEGTKGPQRGEIVMAPKTMKELASIEGGLDGKWVVYTEPVPRRPRTRPGDTPPPLDPAIQERLDVEAKISQSKMLGRVTGSRNELVITSGSIAEKTFEVHPMDVSITIRKSDMDKMLAKAKSGQKVELEFDIKQRFVRGPVANYNVVAEIKGTEKPEEVVILGGHLDSWDGPGSQGAADNANGSSVTLEAARILMKIGAKPKRTIRFVLFSGEEQGLFGSRAYVEQHKSDLDKISAVFIEDGGANYEGGTYALESMVPMFDQILSTMNAAFPDLPMKIRTVATMPRGGGSDHVPFNAVGVPGFFWDETGTVDYNFVHHTQHDRLELIPLNYLTQSSTNSAVTAYVIACAPTMMPRAPKPAGN